MEQKMEIRNLEFEVRADQNEEHGSFITGRPIVFDARTNIGPWDEIIDRGALDETDLKDVRFLVNHNIDMIPLARSRNNTPNSTMQMSVDENGMKYAIVNLAALDAEGRVVPTAENGVRLVAGEGATLLGSANGDPACTVRATSNVRTLFGGRAQAIFRRDASAPAATLTFSAAGLDTVTVEF